ncbi:MAG: DUF4244 domain-containing protein [Ornithinimicrobium sp.]
MKIRHLLRRASPVLRGGSKDAGMTTAEYAVGTLAACALAAVLFAVVTSDTVKGMITTVITTALSVSL